MAAFCLKYHMPSLALALAWRLLVDIRKRVCLYRFCATVFWRLILSDVPSVTKYIKNEIVEHKANVDFKK